MLMQREVNDFDRKSSSRRSLQGSGMPGNSLFSLLNDTNNSRIKHNSEDSGCNTIIFSKSPLSQTEVEQNEHMSLDNVSLL